MNKTLAYPCFIISCISIAFIFLTATTYSQLSAAILLYPIFTFLVLNIFPRRTKKVSLDNTAPSVVPEIRAEVQPKTIESDTNTTDISDIDKRVFLKLIGAAGISVFLFSLFSKRAQVPFFGKFASGPTDSTLLDTQGQKIDPAQHQPLDGYQILEIDDGLIAYYGFANKNGAWLIMRENSDKSFRYSRGESSFPDSWSKREKLNYDYYYNVF